MVSRTTALHRLWFLVLWWSSGHHVVWLLPTGYIQRLAHTSLLPRGDARSASLWTPEIEESSAQSRETPPHPPVSNLKHRELRGALPRKQQSQKINSHGCCWIPGALRPTDELICGVDYVRAGQPLALYQNQNQNKPHLHAVSIFKLYVNFHYCCGNSVHSYCLYILIATTGHTHLHYMDKDLLTV